jgi:uncharacterized membrane protein YkoI
MPRSLVPLTFALALALGLVQPALADSKRPHDHDDAQEALRRAEVLPLAEVLALIEARFDARLIEVEFEREKGQYIYEFKLITADGRIIEVEVDAATGRVLKVEGDPGPVPEGGEGNAGSGG